MKTFGEQFPEITLKVRAQGKTEYSTYSAFTVEELLKDIQKHCLSRSRVKKVIEEIGGTQDLMEARENALKEFGL